MLILTTLKLCLSLPREDFEYHFNNDVEKQARHDGIPYKLRETLFLKSELEQHIQKYVLLCGLCMGSQTRLQEKILLGTVF